MKLAAIAVNKHPSQTTGRCCRIVAVLSDGAPVACLHRRPTAVSDTTVCGLWQFHIRRWYLPLQARPKALTFRSTVCLVGHEDRSSVTRTDRPSVLIWSNTSLLSEMDFPFNPRHAVWHQPCHQVPPKVEEHDIYELFRNLSAISAAQNAAVQKAIEQPELFY
jgi:hypothetical protein